LATARRVCARSAGVYQYFLKVVPTTYMTLAGKKMESNQYSVTDHYRPMDPKMIANANVPPGVFFFYDLSAIKVRWPRPSSVGWPEKASGHNLGWR
jgi:Endoplasmic reticulum vesicle transporter